MALRDAWCVRRNVPRFGRMNTDESGRPSCDEPRLYQAIVTLCEDIARRLHGEGVVQKKFGRDIPIIIQTYDYSEEVLAATERANPAGSLRDFITDVTPPERAGASS